MSASLRAVTFDLWETLMHDTPESAERRRSSRLERLAAVLPGRAQEIGTAYDEVWGWLQADWWSRNADPGFDVQIDWLRRRLGIEPGLVSDLTAAYVEPIFDSPPVPDPAAAPLLADLRSRGLRLALICNTSVTPGWALRRLLTGWGLGSLFDLQLYSDETGIRKPAPEIFHQAARNLGVAIDELLHVGDRPETDEAGAIDAGARALVVGPDLPLERVGATIAAQLNIRPSGQGAA